MPANPRFDLCLTAGVVFATLNLLHLLTWAVGLYVPVSLHALLAAVVLVLALRQRNLNALLAVGLLAVCTLIPLLHPVVEWDARSIWLFHGKRIFLDGSLYAVLDGYAPWTHNDYPVLGPAMFASVARSVGYWNEIAPRAAAGLALAPCLFFAGYVFRSWAAYCAWVSLMLFVCDDQLLTGYMDALGAVNFSVALLALMEAYRQGLPTDKPLPHAPLAMLALSMAQLLFIKNEGVVIAGLLAVTLTPLLIRRPKAMWVVALPWLLFLLLWKLPLMHAGVTTDLVRNEGLLARGWQRLQSFEQYGMILHFFKMLSLPAFVIVGGLLAALVVQPRRLWPLAPALLAVMGYVGTVFLVYLTTYQDLKWHLDTSAIRVLVAFNLGAATLLLHLGYRWWRQAAPTWGLNADSGVGTPSRTPNLG